MIYLPVNKRYYSVLDRDTSGAIILFYYLHKKCVVACKDYQ